MKSIVLYLHMHQPRRLKHYNIFSVGYDHEYWTEKDWFAGTNNERIFKKVAEKSYIPMLTRLEKLVSTYPGFILDEIPASKLVSSPRWAATSSTPSLVTR